MVEVFLRIKKWRPEQHFFLVKGIVFQQGRMKPLGAGEALKLMKDGTFIVKQLNLQKEKILRSFTKLAEQTLRM